VHPSLVASAVTPPLLALDGPGGAWAALIAAARIVPLVWLVPALGGWRLSAALRIALGGMVALACAPPVAPALVQTTVGAMFVLGREVALGASIGICAGAAFRAAELAGVLSGTLTSASGADPSGAAGEGASPSARVGELYLFLGILGFLELGGLTLLVEAVMRSYQVIPVADVDVAGRGPVVGGLPWPVLVRDLAELVLSTTARVFEVALVLAAPVIVAASLVTLAAAFIARAAPRLGPALVSAPVRAWFGLAILVLGLGVFELTGAPGWRGALSSLWPGVGRAIDVWRHR
jgi:flagellar biosynthesis protein FliR